MGKKEVFASKSVDEYEAWPLDLIALSVLPDEGLLGGVHHRGLPVRDAAEKVSNAEVTVPSSQLQARFRVMKLYGLVKDFPASGSRVWARTAAGRDYWMERMAAPGEES